MQSQCMQQLHVQRDPVDEELGCHLGALLKPLSQKRAALFRPRLRGNLEKASTGRFHNSADPSTPRP